MKKNMLAGVIQLVAYRPYKYEGVGYLAVAYNRARYAFSV